jgi:formimidoylglutamate deiminase
MSPHLYTRALGGGAQALGRRGGSIEAGHAADLVVLDTAHPSLVGRAGDALIDAWLFSGNTTPVRDVMVSGEWVVRDAMHRSQSKIAADFARVMRRLGSVL